eukprot:gene18192-21798_t
MPPGADGQQADGGGDQHLAHAGRGDPTHRRKGGGGAHKADRIAPEHVRPAAVGAGQLVRPADQHRDRHGAKDRDQETQGRHQGVRVDGQLASVIPDLTASEGDLMPHDRAAAPTIAVIGSGVSGLSAAWLASKAAKVTLYEKDARIGGHAHTVNPMGDTDVDTGFIVYNEVNYPNLVALFDHLKVPTKE